MYENGGTDSRLHAAQHAIPITHSPLPIINLLQPRIDGSIPRSRARDRRNAPRRPRRDLRARRRARRVRGKGPDVLALFRRALEPCDKIKALYEREVLDCASCCVVGAESSVEC